MSNRNVHKENSRAKDDECEGCFYCGLPFVSFHHEHDHAPVPKNAGGTRVLPICGNCHDMKDRVVFHKWPAGLLMGAVAELTGLGCIRDFSTDGAAFRDDYPTEFPDEWADMSLWARIVWAKMARLANTEPSMVPNF